MPLIRLSQVLPFRGWLEAEGIPTERLLRTAGLPVDPAEAPDLMVAGRSIFSWIGSTARAEGIPDLGVRVGRASRVQDIGALGRSLQAETSLRGALDTFVREVNRHSTHAAFGWAVQGGHAWLWRHKSPGSEVGGEDIEGYVLVLLVQILRLAAGPGWTPDLVRAEMAAVPDALREELPTTQVECGAAMTAIRFPRAMLSSPLRSSVHRGAPAPVEDSPLSLLDVLRRAVECALPVAAPGIEWGAEIAGVSPRTLQRRLRTNGLTWFELVDQVRRETSLRLLADPGSIRDVARAVGYTDPANFSHAFRRWTGTSPGRHRRERIAG